MYRVKSLPVPPTVPSALSLLTLLIGKTFVKYHYYIHLKPFNAKALLLLSTCRATLVTSQCSAAAARKFWPLPRSRTRLSMRYEELNPAAMMGDKRFTGAAGGEKP